MQDITQAKTIVYSKKVETTTLDKEHIKRALQVLIDEGIRKEQAGFVLQAIGYTLIDTELDCDGAEIAQDGDLFYHEYGVEYTYI